jgi:hypothetical protein
VSNPFPTQFKTRTSTKQFWLSLAEKWVAGFRFFGHFSGITLDIAVCVMRNDMRKYLASFIFTGCALAASPLAAAPAVSEAETAAPAVAVHQVRMSASGLRDEAAMVLVGTALIGLAAAVRRTA